jgi:hypothetical protein
MVTIVQRLALGVLALLALATPAGAAEVARVDGVGLDASDSRRAGFCLRLAAGADGFGGGSSRCGQAPWRPRRSMLVTWESGGRLLAGGAAPSAVTRVEAELSDGRRIGVDTVQGPRYRGRYARKLRFFLAVLPLSEPRDEDTHGLVALRLLGADGTVLGIGGTDRLGAPVGRPRVLLRERGGAETLTVRAVTLRRPAPTPRAIDRVEELACVTTERRSPDGIDGGSTTCHEPGPNRPTLLVFPESGCDGRRTVVSGLVGDAVTAVRLVLGSGRVLEVRTGTLLDREGAAHRYVAKAVPRGEAVRSVSAVGVDATYDLREPPSGLPCPPGSGFLAVGLLLGPEDAGPRPQHGAEQVVAEVGGHRLLVRDAEADRLCAGIDALRADGGDCLLPEVNGEDVRGLASSGVVAAVLPTEVARVRLPGGREVETIEGGYRGRYAGTVRFLFAEARAGIRDRFRLLDASGTVIGSLRVFDPEAFYGRPPERRLRLARGRGWRLTAARDRFGSCVYLALGAAEPECVSGIPGEDGAFAAVGCAPRVGVLTGRLGRRTRAVRTVRAVLRGGRTLRARIVRVPRRLGGGRAWVLALPRRARVVALDFGRGRVTFPVLPAADQCGYRIYAPGLDAGAEPELRFERPAAASARAWPGTARPRGSWSSR